jgi:hypothetical protein
MLETFMAKKEEAERIFGQLTAKNQARLLGYFRVALAAENSVKKALNSSVPQVEGSAPDSWKGQKRRNRV